MRRKSGSLLKGNEVTKSLIGHKTPFLFAQVLASSLPCWGAIQLQDKLRLSGQRRMQGKVPGTLLSGLGSSSLLEEGAIVLEERCVLLRVGPRVDPPVSPEVGILIAFLVQYCGMG